MKLTITPESDKDPSYVKVADENDFRSATVKWDGCIHYKEDEGVSENEYLHICDLPGHIAFLQELLRVGKETFGEEWP